MTLRSFAAFESLREKPTSIERISRKGAKTQRKTAKQGTTYLFFFLIRSSQGFRRA